MGALIERAGFHPAIQPAAYFAEPCPTPALTASGISILLAECPAKAAYAHPKIDQPLEEHKKDIERYMIGSGVGKPAQALGGLVHRLSLGKGAAYIVGPYDEYRSNEAKAWRDNALSKGVIPLKEKQYDQAKAMADVMEAAIEEAVEGEEYETEVVIAWQEETPHGTIWLRSMLDVWCEAKNLILDVKTAASIKDDAIDACFNRWGYARQSTFYRRGVDTILSRPGESRFEFLFVESEAPWLNRTVDTSEGFRAGSEMEIERAIATWGKCLAENKWPGHGHRTAEPSAWKVREWMEDELEAGDVE